MEEHPDCTAGMALKWVENRVEEATANLCPSASTTGLLALLFERSCIFTQAFFLHFLRVNVNFPSGFLELHSQLFLCPYSNIFI